MSSPNEPAPMPPTPDAPEPPKGSDVFHASLFLSPEKRRALFALEALLSALRAPGEERS